jgi:hypothetical protein
MDLSEGAQVIPAIVGGNNVECGRLWTNGRSCGLGTDTEHRCNRVADHRTHICSCMATFSAPVLPDVVHLHELPSAS